MNRVRVTTKTLTEHHHNTGFGVNSESVWIHRRIYRQFEPKMYSKIMQIPYKQVHTTTYNGGAGYNEVAPLQYWQFHL